MAANSTSNARDFILVGEFCEVQGPRSVFTIPSSVPHLVHNEHFNLDEFLLYIMTTDYQNFPGDKWSENADVMCVRTNILPNFHAVLHYFTLKDPQARGGVRPSCIAYITQDSEKLYLLKNELSQVIQMSAQIFKQANMRWMRDLGHPIDIQPNLLINDMLEQCSHLCRTVEDEAKLEHWANLCSLGIPVVISGLLKLYRYCSRSLESHILDPRKLSLKGELFGCPSLSDVDFEAVMLHLYK